MSEITGLDIQSLEELRADLDSLMREADTMRRSVISDDTIRIAYYCGKTDAFNHALAILNNILKDQAHRERVGA